MSCVTGAPVDEVAAFQRCAHRDITKGGKDVPVLTGVSQVDKMHTPNQFLRAKLECEKRKNNFLRKDALKAT